MKKENTLRSLEGLSIGDAFGERFFGFNPEERITRRELTPGMWAWTDDTHMAISVVETLFQLGKIDQDVLMDRFCTRFIHDGRMGYGYGARQLLERCYYGEDWRILNQQILPGGSYGNGAAMRAAPIGAYFAGELQRAADEAILSAQVTHAHQEGIAGAIAVAVAASIAAQPQFPIGNDFIRTVIEFMPETLTKKGMEKSLELTPDVDIRKVVANLGNGSNISAQDTVPFCIWCAAHHLHHYEEALWKTVSGLGDRDTTCAIVGGIVALSAPVIPENWKAHREPYPRDFNF